LRCMFATALAASRATPAARPRGTANPTCACPLPHRRRQRRVSSVRSLPSLLISPCLISLCLTPLRNGSSYATGNPSYLPVLINLRGVIPMPSLYSTAGMSQH
jgi:uncharacterized membrane protein